jgi:hypothetical protein
LVPDDSKERSVFIFNGQYVSQEVPEDLLAFEDEGATVLRELGNYSLTNTASDPRRIGSSDMKTSNLARVTNPENGRS